MDIRYSCNQKDFKRYTTEEMREDVYKRQVLGQHLQRALGGGVGRDGLAAQLAHHGADVDDLARALFHHVGQHGLRAVEGLSLIHIFRSRPR